MSDGIAYCTTGVQLRSLDLRIKLDAQGRITGIDGDVSVNLLTRTGKTYILSATGNLTAENYGTAVLPVFDPQRDTRWSNAMTPELAMQMLTEVFSYEQEEAEAFTFTPAGNYLEGTPAGHPDWVYRFGDVVDTWSPFMSVWTESPVEGSVRYFLKMAGDEGWLTRLGDTDKAAMREFCVNFCIEPNA